VVLVVASMTITLLQSGTRLAESAPSAALTTSLATIGFSFTYVSVLARLTLLVGGQLPSILAVFIASATLALMLPPVARMLGRLVHLLGDDPTDLSAA
jgi:hypothetical protein